MNQWPDPVGIHGTLLLLPKVAAFNVPLLFKTTPVRYRIKASFAKRLSYSKICKLSSVNARFICSFRRYLEPQTVDFLVFLSSLDRPCNKNIRQALVRLSWICILTVYFSHAGPRPSLHGQNPASGRSNNKHTHTKLHSHLFTTHTGRRPGG